MTKPKVLKELYIGITIVVLFFLLLGIILMRPYWIFALGLLAGTLGAFAWVYNMYDTLDRALDLSKKSAKSFVAIRSILRQLLAATMMGIALVIHWSAFVGVAIGFLSIKISGLINPHIKKFLYKQDNNDRESGLRS